MKIKESLSRLKTIPIHLLINLDRWLNFELLFVVVVVFFFPTSASRPHQRFPEKRRVVDTF